MFSGLSRIVEPAGLFCLYGPFNEGGEYTSAGNAQLDRWVRARNPESGLRDLDDLRARAPHWIRPRREPLASRQ